MKKTESPTTPPVASIPPKANIVTPMIVRSTAVKKEPEVPKKKAPARVMSKAHECPMFLRKTYHMVDTCDPAVASWSEDGETFVVKDTDVFEKVIIPQFFKHSKFSSFVRQLNFYGFRKIKYNDTIKIDPKLEAETANFWRFHHEKFQRGKPELLIEIKRHSGKESTAAAPAPALSEKTEDVTGVKSEVSVLKERIAVMSKNIDDLTTLVQKLAVKEVEVKQERSKRVKVEEPMDDVAMQFVSDGERDTVSSSLSYTPGAVFPSPPPSRQESLDSSISDEEFLDDLVNVLKDENVDNLAEDSIINGDSAVPSARSSPQSKEENSMDGSRPDPQLMNELGDALATLPKNVQEMLIKRLISTITSKEAIKGHIDAASALSKASGIKSDENKSPVPQVSQSQPTPDVTLPMAAATLGALLSQYGVGTQKAKSCIPKSLTVIPVHA